jgi:hypothetical protein
MRTQRNGTAGKPVLCQMAVSETISAPCSVLPYQLATLMGVQDLVVLWHLYAV